MIKSLAVPPKFKLKLAALALASLGLAGCGGDAVHAFPASRSRAFARSGREAFFMDIALQGVKSVIPAKAGISPFR